MDAPLTVAAFVAEPPAAERRSVLPPPAAAVELRRFTPLNGWESICLVPQEADGLAIGEGGQHCGWRVPAAGGGAEGGGAANGGEDSESGAELYIAELRPGAQPRLLTERAGRCGALSVSADGSAVADSRCGLQISLSKLAVENMRARL